MNIVTGCSGIDAIAYAATLLDIDVIGQIEIDDFCNKILELRYPNVKRLKNVFDVRGDEFGTIVDIFAFGDPCQPHSVAGKMQGTADERYIWPELFRIVETMRPAWILNENVTGSVSNGVVRDKILQLESEGYRARAFTLPACAVGAPHERERAIIMAYSDCHRRGGSKARESIPDEQRDNKTHKQTRRAEFYAAVPGCKTMADTSRDRFQRTKYPGTGERATDMRRRLVDQGTNVADASGAGCEEFDASGIASGQRYGTGSRDEARTDGSTQSGLGGNADGLSSGIYESRGYEDGSGVLTAFETIFEAVLGQIQWPAGYGQQQYDYEPSRVVMGVKNRTNRLKALGNSIVWPQIFPFLLAIKLLQEANV